MALGKKLSLSLFVRVLYDASLCLLYPLLPCVKHTSPSCKLPQRAFFARISTLNVASQVEKLTNTNSHPYTQWNRTLKVSESQPKQDYLNGPWH